MKKITRKALLTAKLYRPGKAGGGATHQIKKLDPAPAEYIEAGSQKHTYVHEPSGSYMSVVTRPTGKRSASVTDLFVPEEHRNKGIAKALQSRVMQDFPSLQGQVSSKIAAKNAYAAGRRLAGNEDASLDDIYRAIDENSSANLWTLKAAGGRTGYADDGAVDDIHRAEAQHFAHGGEVAPPQRTVKAYKLFRTKKNAPGQLFPLFVDANTPVPMGKWVAAKAGDPGKDPTKVKSKLGDLAFRPGWHAGDLPIATHIGGRSHGQPTQPPDFRPADQVWAEVEMPDDVDWQSVANSRARIGKAGEPVASTAHITDQVPHGGHYRYKTNPNMTGNWMIGGSMKVNRILGDDEVKAINDAAGVSDLPRHPDYPAKAAGGRTGYADGGSPKDPLADLGKLNLGTPARYVDNNNFYSKAHHEALKLSQKKGSPQQIRAMLEKAGVKSEEINQSGYDEAFAGRPSITNIEAAQHFREKAPKLQVRRLYSQEHDQYEPEIDDLTRFDEYTLHGQTNYREHLLKLPEKRGEPFFSENRHWPDHRNVVAHVRMGDRSTPIDRDAAQAVIEKMKADDGITRFIGADPSKWASGAADFALERGTITKQEAQALSRYRRWHNDAMRGFVPERNLHVEEIQSDWAQKGRKNGFFSPETQKAREDWDKRFQDLQNQYEDARQGLHMKAMELAGVPTGGDAGLVGLEDAENIDWGKVDAIKRSHPDLEPIRKNLFNLQNDISAHRQNEPEEAPPKGPFVTSTPGWTNLTLKHILTEAVKGGYDRVVLSPGQANVDMYPGLKEEQQKGLRSFYDDVLPAQMNKLARSLDPDHPGMRMFSHTLPPVSNSDDTEGYKGHALDITPDLRDAVNKGLPMFKRGGEVEGEGGEDTPAQNAADHIALLLREGRAKEVTDDLMGQADPKRLYEHYESGNTGMQMPMDEDSRMDRAKALGFDVKAYRGQTGDPGASLNTVRTEGKTAGTGAWATSDPDIAATYSGRENPVSIPLVIKSGEYQTHDFGGNFWGDGPEGKTTDELARASNAPGVQFKNITDVGPHLWNRANVQKRIPEMADSFAIKDPKTVRARFARFDPRLAHLSHLSAATGGAISEQTNDGGVNRNLVNGTNPMVTKALALARNLTRR